MNFTCATHEISHAIKLATKAINGRTDQPILANVLLESDGDHIRVEATDLQMTIATRFPASVTEGGATTLPGKIFCAYLDACAENDTDPETLLQLDSKPGAATVKLRHSACDFKTLPGEIFPRLTLFANGGGQGRNLNSERLREGILATSFAAAKDASIARILSGALIEAEGERLRMVTTDSYRLAFWETTLDVDAVAGDEPPLRIVVPVRALVEAARNVEDPTTTLATFGHGPTHLAIQTGSAHIATRLLDGTYPAYEMIIPKQDTPKTVATATTDELLDALRRVEIATTEGANMVRLEIADGMATLSASSPAAGEAMESVAVEQEGDDLRTAFNAHLLIDIVAHVPTRTVRIAMHSATTAAIIAPGTPQDGTKQFYLLMPLRA
jgi:DNA polymerase-3 subunit beta